MDRRTALKTLTGIFGVTITLPSWADGWKAPDMKEPVLLGKEQKKILADLVDVILPRTDTPGAADLDVPRFVETMVQDCFDETVQSRLRSGLEKLDNEAGKSSGSGFGGLDAPQKLALVTDWGARKESEEQSFINSVKNLTIQGYMSSEYVMTHVTRYELVPARYHGCVDVQS